MASHAPGDGHSERLMTSHNNERCAEYDSRRSEACVGVNKAVCFAPVRRFMFFKLAVSSSSKRARGASNFNSAILPAMSLIIEREGVTRARRGEFGVVTESASRFRKGSGTPHSPRTYSMRSREPRLRRRRRRNRNM